MSHSHNQGRHTRHQYPAPPSLADLGLEEPESERKSGKELTKLKRFRFQLLHNWLTATFDPCRVADIGGGKTEFDLLVGMHAHGCNLTIIEAARAHGCDFVLIPCCVIDEPATLPHDVHWLPWLANQARGAGFLIGYFRLNFRGQPIGFHGAYT